MSASRIHGQALFLLALAAAISGCKAKEEQLYDRPFSCDPKRSPHDCGKDRDGKPMTCFTGSLLGGQDFCTPTCDPGQPPADESLTCLSSGALVQKCQPLAGRADPQVACPDGLACYRTDLMRDDGICLMMTPCDQNADCKGMTGAVCGGVLVRELIAGASTLSTDSLQCVVEGCSASGTCPDDQRCLLKSFASEGMLPDICVPKCDVTTCPPNFSCSRQDDWSPGAPAVCVPGMPGTRCDADQDCMIGVCLDTGAGFRVCTLDSDCRPLDYCAMLDGPVDVFVCAEGIPGRPRCVTLRPFGGANCMVDRDCPTGRECNWYSLSGTPPSHGDCRLPCDDNGRCLPRGGIPFFCGGEDRQGGCSPTQFGAPCIDDNECLESLSCVKVGSDARSQTNYNPYICTLACKTDADCDANHLTFHGGFCQSDESGSGHCRLSGSTGQPCTQETHCRSRQCPAGTCI